MRERKLFIQVSIVMGILALFVIIFIVFLSYMYGREEPVTRITFHQLSDTTYYSWINWREGGLIHSDSGYIIRSGIGSELLVQRYASDPEVHIRVYSRKQEIKFEELFQSELLLNPRLKLRIVE